MQNNPTTSSDIIWANLIHLSYNFWLDREEPKKLPQLTAQPYLRFDQTLWDDLLQQMAAAGMNAVVIDLGDAIQYQSHPEIAIENAWSPDKMRALGIEPLPKLNFSASHDIWLGEYSRMVSSAKYYEVCGDLIREVCELFDTPRYLHLGMDEETAGHQLQQSISVVRQHDLWWHDLFFFVDCVESCGVRAWTWADYIWHHEEEFVRKMPKSVLQSNWYYAWDFDREARDESEELRARRVRTLDTLDQHGFDQVPCGGNYFSTTLPQVLPDLPEDHWQRRRPAMRTDGKPWQGGSNMERTIEWSQDYLAPERIKGFLTAPWVPTQEKWRDAHEEAIEEVGRGRKLFEQRPNSYEQNRQRLD